MKSYFLNHQGENMQYLCLCGSSVLMVAYLELAMRVCLRVSWLTCRVWRAYHSQSVRCDAISTGPCSFHCGPASETEHEAKGIEVH